TPQLAHIVDAEDIVQSVFRRFFEKVSKGCYEVPEGEELWKLFLVIALNKLRDTGAFHQAAKRDVRLRQSGTAFERLLPADKNSAAAATLHLVLQEFLSNLPDLGRKMLELRIAG